MCREKNAFGEGVFGMRHVGDTCNVKVIEVINDRLAKVIDEESNIEGYLKIKRTLKIRSNGTVRAWILQVDRKKNEYTFGNSYFGKYSISENIAQRYISALEKILGYCHAAVTPDDISLLKGMANRCLKHDQWDGFTTYTYLGYPSYQTLNSFVRDSVSLRKQLVEGTDPSLSSFINSYQYMLVSIYSHLTNNVEVDDERVDIPISGFDKHLWDKLLYDSRKNIILVEQMKQQISKYLLMHYFVTLEQEFQNNFLTPFQQQYAGQISTFSLNDPRWKITHELLCGNTHFSLGAVNYLGRCCSWRSAISASDAIDNFVRFLGRNKNNFVDICNAISSRNICGYTLKDLRNELAHGDSTVTNAIDQSAFTELHNFLFAEPENTLKKILVFSMNSGN